VNVDKSLLDQIKEFSWVVESADSRAYPLDAIFWDQFLRFGMVEKFASLDAIILDNSKESS
jgi:hypothetical protein